MELFEALETGRSLSSSDEVWVVPMLVISAISVSVITIYQVSICIRAGNDGPRSFTVLETWDANEKKIANRWFGYQRFEKPPVR